MRQRKRRYHRRFYIVVEYQGYHGWYPWHIKARGFDWRHRPNTTRLRPVFTMTLRLKPVEPPRSS